MVPSNATFPTVRFPSSLLSHRCSVFAAIGPSSMSAMSDTYSFLSNMRFIFFFTASKASSPDAWTTSRPRERAVVWCQCPALQLLRRATNNEYPPTRLFVR